MARGIGPPAIVSPKPQIPCSGVCLRVSNRYFLQLDVVLYIFVELALNFVACLPGMRQNRLKTDNIWSNHKQYQYDG